MTFASVAFLALWSAALLLRLSVGRHGQGRIYEVGLLALSMVFYGWHVPGYVVLILFSTTIDYWAGRALATLPTGNVRRRLVLGLSLTANLGLLGTLKYADFVLGLGTDLLTFVGLGHHPPAALGWVLPVGISFYTFQSMSYTIDVYRGRLDCERDPVRFALFVCFFPQLVAGPIVRAGRFLYQIPRRRGLHTAVLAEGSYLILRGFFLKLIVADNLGRVVDRTWRQASSAEEAGIVTLPIVIFFSLQLFSDFAGYSDIARGLAYQLGYRLPVNFDAPFIATTFREFWRRWHITLSQWMRDYLYVPLGGGRKGRARGAFNLVAVMTISGLWHGAHLNFVFWGLLLGLAVLVERLLGIQGRQRDHDRPTPRLRSLITGFLWFGVVQGTWIASMALFRSADGAEALRTLHNLGLAVVQIDRSIFDPPGTHGWVLTGWGFTLPVLILHLRRFASLRLGIPTPGRYERSIAAGFMIYALLTLYTRSQPFLYFQF